MKPQRRNKAENRNARKSLFGAWTTPMYVFDVLPAAGGSKNVLFSEGEGMPDNETRRANTLRPIVGVNGGHQNLV